MVTTMNKKSKGSALASYLILSMIFASFFVKLVEAEPVERTVGVKVGDMIKYAGFLALWDSDKPTATIPQDLIDFNNTLWAMNTILNISGTTVTFQRSTHYENGTDKSDVGQVDVNTGEGNSTFAFVSAGLTAGGRVYTSEELSSARINSTTPRAYSGLTRETNLLNVTTIDTETSTALWSEYFWDKATGVLVEQFWSYAGIDESGYLTLASVEYEMVDNNIWIGVTDDVPPVADAGPDQTVTLGANVAFDASGSRDNTGIAHFVWDFGDGSTGVGMKTTHTYTKAGTHNVTLTVEDAKGNSAKDTATVTVEVSSSTQLPTSLIVLVVIAAILLTLWILLRRRRSRAKIVMLRAKKRHFFPRRLFECVVCNKLRRAYGTISNLQEESS